MGTARVKKAWEDTPIKWSPIPIGLGVAFIAFLQYSKIVKRESEKNHDPSKALIVGPWHVSSDIKWAMYINAVIHHAQ